MTALGYLILVPLCLVWAGFLFMAAVEHWRPWDEEDDQ